MISEEKKENEEKYFNLPFMNLYEIGKSIKDNIHFDEICEKNKDIFNKIKTELGSNGDKADKFIKDFINFFKIKDEPLIDDLIIFFKIKKYEYDINSIIFFFNYFEKDNESWNKKLSDEYYNLSLLKDFDEIKNKLRLLKSTNIYDYRDKQNYNEIFICLYQKKEAIDFLFNKRNPDLSYLKDLIQPYDQTITIKDINDTEKCIYEIQMMKKIKDNNKIFNYIQSMDQNTIEQFVNYSKIYKFIINLEINSLNKENIYDKIYKIIQNASFNIFHDSEQFIYSNEKKVLL